MNAAAAKVMPFMWLAIKAVTGNAAQVRMKQNTAASAGFLLILLIIFLVSFCREYDKDAIAYTIEDDEVFLKDLPLI